MTGWCAPPPQPDIAGEDVHLWLAQVGDLPEDGRLNASLSPDEQIRAQRLHKRCDRELFVLAHAMLRDVLARYLPLAPQAIRLDTGAHGKPRLARQHGSNLQFSLAHSGGLALLGIARRHEIGVDVEAAVPHDDLADVAAHCFSPDERAALARVEGSARCDLFHILWTRKEACVKAWGKGLRIPLQDFSVLPPTDALTESAIRRPDVDAQTLGYCRTVPVPDGYAAAVVLAGPGSKLSCWHWSVMTAHQR
jgi:4'-phosphopantetheinyl transferase